jgi:acetyl esterase
MGTRSSTSRRVLVAAVCLAVTVGGTRLYGQAKTKRGPGARSSENDEQLKAALARFPQADTDKDGVLTAEEAKAFRPNLEQLRKGMQKRRQQVEKDRPQPSRTDVKYGRHERNVFDLWLPEGASAENPVPVFVYFHGGGFVAGDKSRFDPRPYLGLGYAVVSANYRFVNGKDILAPTPMRDGARVIQFLRHKSRELGIKPDRIAVSGGSAGAVITLWIALKDDMADPESDDPVERQSTRVSCIVPMAGPTNLDPDWIRENLGGPPEVHSSMPAFYGVHDGDFDKPDKKALIKEASPITHASADDPPALLIYAGELGNLPLPENASQGLLIHHPYFGKVLKEKLDELGVECHLRHRGARPSPEEIGEFLAKHLQADGP